MVSTNGGKSFEKIGEKYKHVDNHALWINPADPNQLMVGCDGGIYNTNDASANWEFRSNLPVTQFYKVSTDNAVPFYNVFGGTQDNNSLVGPSRTISSNGITNSDWKITLEGDGFETQVDPENPDIVYPQAQYGGIARYDKKSGEVVDIKPIEGEGEPAFRWNWDSPLLISSHKHTRLYFAANKLFKSDDMGNTWQTISGDLSRQIDRNKLPVMGKSLGYGCLVKTGSTDIYEYCLYLESKFDENHLVIGTDDGLIQVTKDGGKTGRKLIISRVRGGAYFVNRIIASRHDKELFSMQPANHHRYGNFKPFVFKSKRRRNVKVSDRGNPPERGVSIQLPKIM
ncbi:MAG: hypothetical protein IPF81_15975 [Bacteroidetes bacterium]|nr:hypothetical protein [Bacteroidota bacterium]